MKTEWRPKIGDHVWHVAEYLTTASGMRKRGLDGFRPYGLEVVESEITGILDNGTFSAIGIVTSDRIGNIEGSNIFRWTQFDLNKIVFQNRKDAAFSANLRMHDIEHGNPGSVYENKPMYKNWLHWINTDKTPVLKTKKYVHVLPKKWDMDVYNEWLHGLSCRNASLKLGIPAATFNIHARRLAKERGDIRINPNGGRPETFVLPDNFNDVFEEYEQGNLRLKDAAEKCGMTSGQFKYQFEKLQKRRLKAEIESGEPEPQEYEPEHIDDIDLGHHNFQAKRHEGAE